MQAAHGAGVLLGLLPDALAERLESATRARAVTRALSNGLDAYTSEALPLGIRRRLAATTKPTPYSIAERVVAADGTTKLLVDLGGRRRVETVRIPGRRRNTLCVSSQVGCKRACHFCLTGTMGLVENLRADEIVLQFWLARQEAPIRNIVFMGMGEPLDNFDEVARAVGVLTSPRGMAVAPRHVTVSTVGPSPSAVRRLLELECRVAWSLHAANDDVRSTMIGTHRHEVTALRDAFAEVCAARRQPLFVEVTLVDGVNDRDEDARALIELFAAFPTEVRFNLLPMNPIGNHLAPSARASAFAAPLIEAGHFTSVRRSRGDDERSACGQLYAQLPSRNR